MRIYSHIFIYAQVLDTSPGVAFDDIVGLTEAKQALREAIILPAMRPGITHIYIHLCVYMGTYAYLYICIYMYKFTCVAISINQRYANLASSPLRARVSLISIFICVRT